MKKLLPFLLAVLLPASLGAQGLGIESDSLVLASTYDLDSTSFIYCNTLGTGRSPAGRNKLPPNNSTVSTSGSSTTLTATNAGYTNVAVGDPLWINDDGVQLQRVVVARASATSITINAAVDVTTAAWEYRTLTCGTADTSGAVPVTAFESLTFQVILAQENSASTDHQVECRVFGPGTAWNIISGPTNNTSTYNTYVATNLGWDECRVGIRVNTDDGTDTGAAAEQYTILLNRRK